MVVRADDFDRSLFCFPGLAKTSTGFFMTDLLSTLRRRIETTGPISVSDYMTECLCHPGFGYYTTRDPFGIAGDFTTAPEISQVFGELLGLWAAVTWQQMGSPQELHLVELGPGRGTLMNDALRATQNVPGFHDSLQVHLVEISPVLKERQQESLKDWPLTVHWQDSVQNVPDGPALILANEFFDALPIRQFEKGDKGWAERFVDIDPDGNGLRFILKRDEAALALMPPGLKEQQAGKLFEISPVSQAIAHLLGRRLHEQGGAVLAIDYGSQNASFGESLQALQDHQYTGLLDAPGHADLTAHVDFETLSHCFEETGACVYGPIEQGLFLERLGMTQRFHALLAAAPENKREDLMAAHKRLCDPQEMGSLFKVICATHPDHPVPAAFE
jgi:NADH dehydrogenase [ubiquinone] 1 alpha subcomplex assembly factor 7